MVDISLTGVQSTRANDGQYFPDWCVVDLNKSWSIAPWLVCSLLEQTMVDISLTGLQSTRANDGRYLPDWSAVD